MVGLDGDPAQTNHFLNLKWVKAGIAVIIIFTLDALQAVDSQVGEGGHDDLNPAFEQVIGQHQRQEQSPREDPEERGYEDEYQRVHQLPYQGAADGARPQPASLGAD